MRSNNKDRQRYAAGRSAANDVDGELSRISTLALDALRADWRQRFDTDPPPIRSRDVLLGLLAWRIQADMYGGLDSQTERKLCHIAVALDHDGTYEPQITRTLSPGVVVTREWKGTVHKVTVTPGGFQHLGKSYRSLSDIARTITGTRWSGPRFFGLEQRTVRSARKAVS